jgi:hypothetical protein
MKQVEEMVNEESEPETTLALVDILLKETEDIMKDIEGTKGSRGHSI